MQKSIFIALFNEKIIGYDHEIKVLPLWTHFWSADDIIVATIGNLITGLQPTLVDKFDKREHLT